MAGLPDDDARDEVMELLERVRARFDAYPDIRDEAVEVRDIGWLY